MTADLIMLALEEEVECYRRLSKLAALQHEHVQQRRTEALLEVLEKRQAVLDRIGTLEQGLSGAKKQWKKYVAGLDGLNRSRAEAMLVETRALLEQITMADRNDALVLQQQKLSLGRQIKQAAEARQVNRSYAAAAYGVRTPRMDVAR